MDVSVVIVTRDERDMLARTVDVIAATLPRCSELIVVDDASSDGSVDAVRDRPAVKVLRNSSRVGVARSRNAGARVASGDLLVFSDAHVAPEARWLELLTEAASQPGIGAVGPTLTHLSGSPGVGRGLTWVSPELALSWLRQSGTAPLPVPLLCGCFIAMPRVAFEAVGGFDEAFSSYGGEDVELCVRLWRLGYECLIEPRAVVAHRFRRGRPDHPPVEDRVYNLLRIGTLHFGPPHLAQLRQALKRYPAFPAADKRVVDSGIAARRAHLDAAAVVDPGWMFRRFNLTCFEAAE